MLLPKIIFSAVPEWRRRRCAPLGASLSRAQRLRQRGSNSPQHLHGDARLLNTAITAARSPSTDKDTRAARNRRETAPAHFLPRAPASPREMPADTLDGELLRALLDETALPRAVRGVASNLVEKLHETLSGA